jgi:hypothetical protein
MRSKNVYPCQEIIFATFRIMKFQKIQRIDQADSLIPYPSSGSLFG